MGTPPGDARRRKSPSPCDRLFRRLFVEFIDGRASAAQAVIAEALSEYSTRFSDEVTVSLKFKNSGTGLGSSSTYRFNRPFGEYYSALIADASTVNDQVALASLNPSLPANQVYGPEFIQTTRAGFAAVGINVTTNHIPDYFDGRIDLNLSLTNYDRLAIDPLKYDLRAVVWHEVNEILGTSSGIGGVPTVGDIFRYRSDGARTFTTEGDDAYFSIDGITPLARFNQQAGLDYGDFWSGPNHLPQVQDASGTPGATPNMGVEIVMLDVVGWNAVPEPSALAMISLTMSRISSRAASRSSWANCVRSMASIRALKIVPLMS